MITPYLVYKELLPCGRLAWRRMVNPAFSEVPAIDVAYQKRHLNLNLESVDFPSKIVDHKPKVILSQNLILPNLVVNPPLEKGH